MTQTILFTLYTSPLSANGRKVLAVTKQLRLDPEFKEVNVYKGEGQTPDYLAINPFGKIPTLVENDFILWESNAIIQYIADKHGDYRLSSKDPRKRANISRWLFWEASHWQPAISNVLAEIVGHALIPEYVPKPKNDPNWDSKSFVALATYLDKHLENRIFLSNDELTIADFSVAGMMTYFRFGKFPFERYPNIARWYDSIEALEAWDSTKTNLWEATTK